MAELLGLSICIYFILGTASLCVIKQQLRNNERKKMLESKQNKICDLWKSNLKQVLELWLVLFGIKLQFFRAYVVLCGDQ